MIKDAVSLKLKAQSSKLQIPKVSIILTSYNHAAYVAAAIDSALNQTFTDFELLIIDDGSADNSREIIKTFDDARIKTFLYEVNRGPVIAIRDAVQSARGEYIAVHHSDDLWTPDKLEKQVAFLDANPNYAACFTWVDFVDEHGNVQSLHKKDFYRKIFEQSNRTRAEWLNYFFHNANCLCHPSAMVRRAAYENFHLLDLHGFWQLPDLLMWIRLCFNAELFILPERLTLFRLRRERQENTSATTFDKLVRADLEFYFVAREFAEHFTDDKFFLAVFPEAEKFLIDGQINRRFAFAKLCLDRNISAFNLAGLELLKNLLSSPVDAAQIKQLYDYDEKSFLRDGGSYDVFNLAQKFNTIRAEFFIDDGEKISLVGTKVINVDAERKIYGRIDINFDKPAKFLRFDPDVNFISLKINRALIDGTPCEIFSSNVGEIVDGFYRFWTNDPQIFFDAQNLSGHVTFEIFGELEENYPAILSRTISESRAEVDRLTTIVNSILNFTSWKLTAPLRNFKQWLSSDKKDKALLAARSLYQAMPIDDDKKLAIKDKFYTCFAPLLKDTQRYKAWKISRNFVPAPQVHWENSFDGELFEQPGKIAIQVHIFYLDLLREMVAACKNMPYKFDALISIVDKSAAEKVQAAFKKIPTAEKIIVRVVPNRGRDVAPFIAGFGDLLPEYDFIVHIHTKKSLYTGAEQFSWRKYLVNALLGKSERVRKIFKAFVDNQSLGVIYPRPAPNVPYAAFNWLSNREVGSQLLMRAGIAPNKTDYFDFPAGTMFWARTKALRKIFDLGLTFEDFPPELKQNDGTPAHAFERSILLAARSENMTYCEFDPLSETYLLNLGSKNLWQYFGRTDAEVRDGMLNQGEIISFAAFDTLMMRCVAKAYHVKEIVALKVEDLLGKNFDFTTWREEAELAARRFKDGDPTLDEIYKNFAALTNLDADTCKKIRELEVATEFKLAVPRERIVDWFNTALERGKKVWIISDSTMQTRDLERLLKKCDVAGYEKILISCETGFRKEDATIWEHLAEENLNSPHKLTHLGSNEMSDIQLCGDRGFGEYHLMSAINLFSQIPFGRNLLEQLGYKMSLYAGILLGVVLAKKFHDPFGICREFTSESGRLVLKNFRELGYWFYGAPLLTFTLQLIKKSRAEKILRDGDFLQELYKFVAERLNVDSTVDDSEGVVDINSFFQRHKDLFEKIFTASDSPNLRVIHEGIKDFCRDVTEIFGDILLRVPIDEIFIDAWIESFVRDTKIVAPELRRI